MNNIEIKEYFKQKDEQEKIVIINNSKYKIQIEYFDKIYGNIKNITHICVDSPG
jgi:hypothetical protein